MNEKQNVLDLIGAALQEYGLEVTTDGDSILFEVLGKEYSLFADSLREVQDEDSTTLTGPSVASREA